MRFRFPLAIALCAFLLGCDQASLMKRYTPPEDETVARQYAELLRQGKFEEIRRNAAPSLVDSNFPALMAHMSALFPIQDPKSVKVVGTHISRVHENDAADITLEYEFPRKWILVNVKILKADDATTITGLGVATMEDSLENLYKFTLYKKSAIQYLILALAASSLLLSLYAFVLSARTKIEKRKWLWMLFTLVGVCKVTVGWATG